MTSPSTSPDRVTIEGKFFRCGGSRFQVKGVTYGPFAPGEDGGHFTSAEQTARDFAQIVELGANVLRVYYVPPRWLLDMAARHGLKVLIDIPWAKHLCFLDSLESRNAALQTVREAVQAGKDHPAVFAYSVVNEISAEIVRWSGVRRVEGFIDLLVAEAKAIDPGCLCTFTSFPPTEYLQPRGIDFVCFNVYLHQRPSFEGYLARLQTLADSKPLVLGEFGMDSMREGEAPKSEFLSWQIEGACRAGLAGTVVFSFTDDWWRGGVQIDDWAFGLTTRDRQPKDSFQVVQRQYRVAPRFPPARTPRVSVVVATFNGARTLQRCLESLGRLNYPDYEVIVVDDGSTDGTAEIAKSFPSIRYVGQANQGLSVARNAGLAAATGEIVAFTDDDCRADEGWLHYLVGDLLAGSWVGIGGHNFLPPDDSPVAAAVMASPGGPAHVMLTDLEAEHIPGCNMAFFKWALDEIGGFDPVFRKAGDDVDVCWRLQDRDYKLGFSPAGFVWHHRRSTIKAYFKQQQGYGEAEALLARKHPERFNKFGGSVWRGRIYSAAHAGLLLRGAVIYHGIFGSGFFQRLYAPAPFQPLMLCASLGYHLCLNLPLILLSVYWSPLWPVALASLSVSLGVSVLAAVQARLPQAKSRRWSRPLVAFLFQAQPIVRSWGRLRSKFTLGTERQPGPHVATTTDDGGLEPELLGYWSSDYFDRYAMLQRMGEVFAAAGWSRRPDTGWRTHDFEVAENWSAWLRLTTASEELDRGQKNLRCRLRSAWSFPAILLFWTVTAVVILLIDRFAEAAPWTWMFLMLPALLHGWIENDRRHIHAATAGKLDDLARELKLVRFTPPLPNDACRHSPR